MMSALVAHTAWHWALDRGNTLLGYQLPELSLQNLASGIRLLMVIIAAAGGAAHLPGMVASKTLVPVLGVPIQSKALNGLDSLLSIVQMPAGIPVATFAIGTAGAVNAALFAAQLLGASHPEIREALRAYRIAQTQSVAEHPDPAVG